MAIWQEVEAYRKRHGTRYTLRRGTDKLLQKTLGTYDRIRARQLPKAEELARQKEHQPAGGLISVVIPVYNTDPALLEALLDSLRRQTYEQWEAILYDGCSTRAETAAALDRAAEEEPRFRVTHGTENAGISGNTNAAISLAKGAYIALCDHDDLLSPEALWQAAACIEKEAPDLIYSDEDRVTQSGRHYMDPHYKPDYCPVNLLTANYICHLAVIRKETLAAAGGLRSGFDGSQDHDLFLRIAEITRKICHIPRTLYSWRAVSSSMSHTNLQRCLESGCRAVEEHEKRMGYTVTAIPVDREIRLWYDTPREATVEALIFGNSEESCREGLRELADQTGFKNLTAALLVTDPENLYASLNEAAAGSAADYLLMLDARVRGMNRRFIRELMMYAQREDTCAVTPVLTDEKRRITHGGFAVGVEGLARCVNENLYITAGGWHDTMNRTHNVSAVSICCAMIRRACFRPFDPGFRGGLGMVDWCLQRQKETGALAVFTPHADAYMPKDPLLLSGTQRDAGDAERFRARHGEAAADPCYSPRFGRKSANYLRL